MRIMISIKVRCIQVVIERVQVISLSCLNNNLSMTFIWCLVPLWGLLIKALDELRWQSLHLILFYHHPR